MSAGFGATTGRAAKENLVAIPDSSTKPKMKTFFGHFKQRYGVPKGLLLGSLKT